MSVMIVPGHITETPHFMQGVIEGNNYPLCDGKLMMARSVVNTSMEIPLRVMNMSVQPQSLHGKACVGTCEPVANVEPQISDQEESQDVKADAGWQIMS